MDSRPSQVNQAAILTISTFLVGFLKSYLEREIVFSLGSPIFIFFVMFSTVLVISFLTYKLWTGSNWARILFTILFILGLYPALTAIPGEASRSFLVAICSAWQIVGQAIATILIFLPISNKWFSKSWQAKDA
jgi:hypothetical protein